MNDIDEGYYGGEYDDLVPLTPNIEQYEGCNVNDLDRIMELMTHYKLIRFPCYLFTLKHRRHIKLRLHRVVSKALRLKTEPLIVLRHYANILLEERGQIFRFFAKIYNFQNPGFHQWFLDLRDKFHFLNANECDDEFFDGLRESINNISSDNVYSKFCITMVFIDKVIQRVVKWYETRYYSKFHFDTWYFIDIFDYEIEDCDREMDSGLYLPFDDDATDSDSDSSYISISSSAEDSDSSFQFTDSDD